MTAGLLGVAFGFQLNAFAQNSPVLKWPDPVPNRQSVAEKDKKPAPKRSLAGLWGSRLGNQAKGVQLRPNDGTPAKRYCRTRRSGGSYTRPTRRSKAGMPFRRAQDRTDPRVTCEPLGFPRDNHYDLGARIFQDEHTVAILYNYDNRWRTIWIDGRSAPTLVDGGVEIDGDYLEQRWMGYSVGKWLDDYTLEVQTVGTMSEERVWLDNTGRPISDKARITETFRRLDYDTLEWSETLDDPKMYTQPFQTMKIPMILQDGRTDVLTR